MINCLNNTVNCNFYFYKFTKKKIKILLALKWGKKHWQICATEIPFEYRNKYVRFSRRLKKIYGISDSVWTNANRKNRKEKKSRLIFSFLLFIHFLPCSSSDSHFSHKHACIHTLIVWIPHHTTPHHDLECKKTLKKIARNCVHKMKLKLLSPSRPFPFLSWWMYGIVNVNHKLKLNLNLNMKCDCDFELNLKLKLLMCDDMIAG